MWPRTRASSTRCWCRSLPRTGNGSLTCASSTRPISAPRCWTTPSAIPGCHTTTDGGGCGILAASLPPRVRRSVPAGRRPHDCYRCCMKPSRKPASLLPGIARLALSATGVHAHQGDQYVCFETNLGEFCMVLYPDTAPATVANFLNSVEDGDYDNTIIHRSAPRFVIQGGGYVYDPEE